MFWGKVGGYKCILVGGKCVSNCGQRDYGGLKMISKSLPFSLTERCDVISLPLNLDWF